MKKSVFIIALVAIIAIIAIVAITINKVQSNTIILNNANNINSINNDQDKMTGNTIKQSENTQVLLETTEGNITIELYSDMPITTGNFEKLVSQGIYNGVIFHRVIDGFMIQGGDPTGTGYGDPKIPNIKDEFTHKPKNSNDRGTISMANAGPNTGSSQFFINLVNNNFLDSKHPAFGKVIEGMDIVDKIAKTNTGANDRPVKEIKIISATII